MPDEIEVPIDDAQDRVIEVHKELHRKKAHHQESEHEKDPEHEEEKEKPEASWAGYVGVSTALLAVVAAIGALQAGRLVNESLLQKNNQVAQLTAASDVWNEYQAEGLKSIVYSSASQSAPPGSPLAAKDLALSKHYADKKDGLMKEAKQLEEESKKSDEGSERFLKRHEMFAFSVSLCQIAIALSAVAALTKRRRIWICGLAAGAAGFALMLYGLIHS